MLGLIYLTMTRSTMSLRSGASRTNGVTKGPAMVPAGRDHDPHRSSGKHATTKSMDEARPSKRQRTEDTPQPSLKTVLRSRQPKAIHDNLPTARVSPPVIHSEPATRPTRNLSKHHEKPIKISEDPVERRETPDFRLQIHIPAEKRSLRSQDGGSRQKGELSQFFQNYDQMISLEPAKDGKFAGIDSRRAVLTVSRTLD